MIRADPWVTGLSRPPSPGPGSRERLGQELRLRENDPTANRTGEIRHDRAGESVAAPRYPMPPGRPALLAYDGRHDSPGATGAGEKWPCPDGSRSARPHTHTGRPPRTTSRGASSSRRADRKHQTAEFPATRSVRTEGRTA
jgi:hypothetical protein